MCRSGSLALAAGNAARNGALVVTLRLTKTSETLHSVQESPRLASAAA
jgi:hypothetical protein